MILSKIIRRALPALGATLFLTRGTTADNHETCPTLEDTFATPILEDNTGVLPLGDVESPGGMFIWSDNPLTVGDTDRTAGTSSGRCTLLTGLRHFFCYGIIKLSEKDTISYSGLSPNFEGPATYVITGGTGCYQDATGHLTATPTNADWVAYTWEYVPVAVSESCVSMQDLIGAGLVEPATNTTVVGEVGPGSLAVWDANPVLNSVEEAVGLSYGECTTLPDGLAYMCLGVLTLNSGDMIAWTGLQSNDVVNSTLAVTGGTGCYEGAGGTILFAPQDETFSAYHWKYMDAPPAEECTQTLVEAVGGDPRLYEENINSENLGEGEGAQDIWFQNPVHAGATDGPVQSSVSGQCLLLAGATEYYCVSQFDLDSGSSFVSGGFSPNSDATGIYVINGGTGCFNGIKGAINITALTINSEFDYFLNEIVSTNEESAEATTESTTAATTAGSTVAAATTLAPDSVEGTTTEATTDESTVTEPTVVEDPQGEEEVCTPIDALFAEPIYEDNSALVNIGGYEEPGAFLIWSDNPLTVGDAAGAAAGTSSGRCSLLTGGTQWFCYGIIKLSDKDTISFTGLSPNSFDTANLVITGGTGCYKDATGELSMDPVAEDWAAYTWGYIPGTSSSSCVSMKDLVGSGLVEESTGTTLIGDTETSGSLAVWHSNPVRNSNDENVGVSYGECTLLPGSTALMCLGILELTGGDMVSWTGLQYNSVANATLAVTGGTGCYEGAGGTLLVAPDETYTTYDWKFVDAPPAEECTQTLLEAIGGDPKLYEENINSEIIGVVDTQGAQDIWYNNPAHSGATDGPETATVSGQCMLLAGSTEYFCISHFIFENIEGGSSFVSGGFSPNSDATGIYVVNGGTGCFNGIKGEIGITAMSVNTEYDYFLNELVSTNDGSFEIDSEEEPTDEVTETEETEEGLETEEGTVTEEDTDEPADEEGTDEGDESTDSSESEEESAATARSLFFYCFATVAAMVAGLNF